MKFHLYQIVLTLIAFFMIYQGIRSFVKGKKNQSLLKLSTRIIVWGGMAAVAIYPNLSSIIAHIIGIEGNMNAVILIGFLFIFLIIFKLLSAIERLEQDLSIVTRNDALKEIEK